MSSSISASNRGVRSFLGYGGARGKLKTRPAAVWASHGVEERLLDAFMGRPNDSLVRMWKELE
ncbi:hypothetical protein F0U62_13280 [Cystobacter fuscus]|nr:hypothetical protein F0U62_13280 [Cystobacter fuscus]